MSANAALYPWRAPSYLQGIPGRLLIHEEAWRGYVDAVCEQLDLGVDIDAPDKSNDGFTALQTAAAFGVHGVVTLLLERKASVNKTDAHGRVPLHYASINGYAVIAALLIDAKADVDKLNEVGETPLMWAAKTGRDNCAKLLLERKAQIGLENASGHTAATIPRMQGYPSKACDDLLLAASTSPAPEAPPAPLPSAGRRARAQAAAALQALMPHLRRVQQAAMRIRLRMLAASRLPTKRTANRGVRACSMQYVLQICRLSHLKIRTFLTLCATFRFANDHAVHKHERARCRLKISPRAFRTNCNSQKFEKCGSLQAVSMKYM